MTDLFDLTMDPNALLSVSELGLAHVGDAVFELLVRTRLCCEGSATNRTLHKKTVAQVAAPAQAAFAERILPLLSEQELAVYRRGRNAHPHQIPKNASPAQYSRATGLETLFGWLWLTGQRARINTLFGAGTEDGHAL